MNTCLAICLAIVIAILFAPATYASSGALRRATIKQCPNGIYYSIRGGDNHWHQAEQSNVSSGWSAVGDAFYYDPCPPDEVVYVPVKEEPAPAPVPAPASEPESAPETSPESDDGYIVGFIAEPSYVDQADSNEPATSAAAQAGSDADAESDNQEEDEEDKQDDEIASSDSRGKYNYGRDDNDEDDWDTQSSSTNSSNEKKKSGKGSAVAVGLMEIAAVAGGVYAVKKKKK
ncbi:hypothetical protein IKM56_02880 [Candidatus Saccharibacteria bacterium]|nr:hypothetical protein [Candidatus Saccharibacteria bacterium]